MNRNEAPVAPGAVDVDENAMEGEPPRKIGDMIFVCVLIGDSNVGKTCTLMTLQEGAFPAEYVPIVALISPQQYRLASGKSVTILFRDTGHGEDYDKIRIARTYKGADLVFVCFSVVSPASFDNINRRWVRELAEHCPGVQFVLVGTKIDLRNDPDVVDSLSQKKLAPITTAMGEAKAAEIGALRYMEFSTYKKENFDEIWKCAAEYCYTWRRPRLPVLPKLLHIPTIPQSASRFAADLSATFDQSDTLHKDVKFVWEAQSVMAHSVLLKASSPAFRKNQISAAFVRASTKGSDNVLVHAVKEECWSPLLGWLNVIYYGNGTESALRDTARLAQLVGRMGEELVERWREMTVDDALERDRKAQVKPQITALLPCLQTLGAYLDSKETADISLLCAGNDQPLYAHRAVLSMRCPRFRALFASGMADSKQAQLPVMHHTRTTMRIVLRYLYTDDYSDAPDPRLVLAAANEYNIDRLHTLAAQLNAENMLDTLQAAVTHNFPILADICMHVMRTNWKEYSGREDVKERLSTEQFEELVRTQYPPLSYIAAEAEYKAAVIAYDKKLREWQDARRAESEKCALQ